VPFRHQVLGAQAAQQQVRCSWQPARTGDRRPEGLDDLAVRDNGLGLGEEAALDHRRNTIRTRNEVESPAWADRPSRAAPATGSSAVPSVSPAARLAGASGAGRQATREGVVPHKKAAATATILRQMLAPIPDDLRGLRDRALLLTGFAGALRRSELAAIRVEHLEKTERGLRLTLPQTKGSQAEAVTVPLPYGHTELCPVRALAAWQDRANITAGPVFRRIWQPKKAAPGEPPPLPRIGTQPITSWAVAAIVKARAAAAGFGGWDFGGHSLKRGALTTGMDRGEHPAKLKRLGRYKTFDVLGEYLEFGDLFDGHPLNDVL
jgi:integrase